MCDKCGDCVLIASDEATDRSHRLRECTHDKVDLIGKSEVVANTTTLLAKHTDTVSLVYHNRAVVLMLQLYNSRQVSKVTLH